MDRSIFFDIGKVLWSLDALLDLLTILQVLSYIQHSGVEDVGHLVSPQILLREDPINLRMPVRAVQPHRSHLLYAVDLVHMFDQRLLKTGEVAAQVLHDSKS